MRMRWLVVLTLAVGCGSQEEGTPPALAASVVEVLQGNGQTDTVGQQLPVPILVQVIDTTPAGAASFAPPAPVPGQLVNFVVVSGGGHVFAGASLTDSLGRAQELWTLGTGAGPQTLEARAVDPESGAPIVYATITATAVAGAPAHLTINNAAQRLFLDSAWGWRPRVLTVTDQYGNALPTARAQASAAGLTLAGDSVTAPTEADGWLVLSAGASDSLPWSARRDLRGAWTIAYRCSGPKVAMTGNDGVTPIDSVSFAGAVDFAIAGANWTYTSALTVTRYLQGGGTEQAPTGDVFAASQGIGTLNVGGVAMAWTGAGYTGGDFCGPSLWTTHTDAVLARP